MKRKSLNFIVPLVVYPFDVMVSLGQTDEQLKNSLMQFKLEFDDTMELNGGRGKFWMFLETNHSVIRIHSIPTTNEDYGTLQHEIFHAVSHILDRVGMKLKLTVSDEAYCYLIGFLTTEIYKQL